MEHEPACWQWEVTDAARGVAASLEAGDFPEARELLFAWQDSRCALCGYQCEPLIVDHCHRTALVRGLLCQGCNVMEGRAGKNGNPRVTAYRSKHPAQMLGLDVVYHNLHGPVPPDYDLLAAEAITPEDIEEFFARRGEN
jgi:hypothetical protein